jgi:ribosome-binding protein aMBF1 (putative translation factor)
MQIIELVLTCRDKLGSNVALAKALKVEPHAINRWLKGQHEPRLKTVRLLERLRDSK